MIRCSGEEKVHVINLFLRLLYQHISASKGYADISYFLVEQGVNVNIAG